MLDVRHRLSQLQRVPQTDHMIQARVDQNRAL